MKKSVFVLAGITLLGAAAAWAGENEKLRAIGEGRGIYLMHCASCHGERALGGSAVGYEGGVVAPDLTLIEHRDGRYRGVHVALHVENRDKKAPMRDWPRILDRAYPVPCELQLWKLVKYIDSVQRADASAELMDNPVPYR